MSKKKDISGWCEHDMCSTCKMEWCECICHGKQDNESQINN
jgi:hypothetical protein